MFTENSEICNFIDDNTKTYLIEKKIGKTYLIDFHLENLKHDMKILLLWFRINSFQANPGIFQFTILRKKKRNSVKLIINSTEIEEDKKVVLLCITINNL